MRDSLALRFDAVPKVSQNLLKTSVERDSKSAITSTVLYAFRSAKVISRAMLFKICESK